MGILFSLLFHLDFLLLLLLPSSTLQRTLFHSPHSALKTLHRTVKRWPVEHVHNAAKLFQNSDKCRHACEVCRSTAQQPQNKNPENGTCNTDSWTRVNKAAEKKLIAIFCISAHTLSDDLPWPAAICNKVDVFDFGPAILYEWTVNSRNDELKNKDFSEISIGQRYEPKRVESGKRDANASRRMSLQFLGAVSRHSRNCSFNWKTSGDYVGRIGKWTKDCAKSGRAWRTTIATPSDNWI